MPGEFFFMAMGGLGVSMAGFAGLIAALTPDHQRSSAVARWRISHIVIWGLHLTFLGFGVVAIFALVNDTATTARLASGLATLLLAVREWRSTRPGPAWPKDRDRRFVIGIATTGVLVFTANVFFGNVGYLHVIMLAMLLPPAMVFASAVKDRPSPGTTGRRKKPQRWGASPKNLCSEQHDWRKSGRSVALRLFRAALHRRPVLP